MKFSIIIPTYNSRQYLPACLESVEKQDFPASDFEVLVVDDCSIDDSIKVAEAHGVRLDNFQLIALGANGGPGMARNEGLARARGEWVLFVDSDDELSADCLSCLNNFIDNNSTSSLAAVGFDWIAINAESVLNSSQRVGRRDGHLLGDRDRLMRHYLTHRMDGSVIYTAVRRDMIERHGLYFDSGLHEDVDYIFRVYFHASETAYLDRVLYRKRGHSTSIINNISAAHIDGYFRAWIAIGDFIRRAGSGSDWLSRYLEDYRYGSIGAVATRVREVIRHIDDLAEAGLLFDRIYEWSQCLNRDYGFESSLAACKTVYCNITTLFIGLMSSAQYDIQKYADIVYKVQDMSGKSWSCVDLHHSLFLRPDQVRTCCKRFFVDGEMRGDVALFAVPAQPEVPLSIGQILNAKRELHQNINSGVGSACDSCPFLEFREWNTLNELDIRYLSLEYHSICNLKCRYCSDEYYGGKKASYDLQGSVECLLDAGALNNCALTVWGGGEPVIGDGFSYLVNKLAAELPGMQQRVLTNSIKKSTDVDALLQNRQGQIVTSIDAGSDYVFELVRGKSKLNKVCENLRHYANLNCNRVTIKYIFTEGNGSADDVSNFVVLMRKYDLLRCVFQISSDFKHEVLAEEIVINMMLLFGLLKKAGVQNVYFDELLWHRLTDMDIKKHVLRIHQLVGYEFIALPEKYPSVVVWGAGQQAKYLIGKSDFFKRVNVDFFVDATPEKQGTVFYDREVRNPEALLLCDTPVIIAAVQGYPLIAEQYAALGCSRSRLLQELII